MSCGCAAHVPGMSHALKRNVVEDARAEFERQTRQLIADLADQPAIIREQAILAEIKRFSQERYNRTRGVTIELLRAAL